MRHLLRRLVWFSMGGLRARRGACWGSEADSRVSGRTAGGLSASRSHVEVGGGYVSAVRWGTQMDLETLLRAMLEIVEGWGGVPWAWVFDNMKTVTLGRDAAGQPRWNPAFWRFATEVGCHPELCDPGAPQQKGSVESVAGMRGARPAGRARARASPRRSRPTRPPS